MQKATIFKIIRKFFLGLLATLLIVLATLSALLETEAGSRWIANGVAGIVGIELQGIHGNLREGLDVDSLMYDSGQQSYSARGLSVRWRPVDLLYGTFAIQSLRAEAVVIKLPPPIEQQAPAALFSQWPKLGLPLIIDLQNIHINNISLVRGEQTQRWQTLRGALNWGQFNLTYTNVAVIHDTYTLLLTGNSELSFPYQTRANLQWQWQALAPDNSANPTSAAPAENEAPPLAYIGVSEMNGDLRQLAISTRMSAPVILSLDMSGALVNENNELQTEPDLQLQASWAQQMLPSAWWVGNQAVPVTNGTLSATGNWKNYRAELQGDIAIPQAPLLGVSASVEGDLEKIRINFLRVRERYFEAVANAVIPPSATSSSAASAAGPLVIASSAQASSASAPNLQLVDSNAGLSLEGDVRWSPQLDWRISTHAEHLNLASLFENWPSNISATFLTRGTRENAGWDIQLQNLALDGDLRGVSIRGGGSLAFDGKQLRSEDLQLVLGANQVRLKGELGREYNLEWNINAPMLGQIDNSFNGSLITTGKLRGNLQKPQVDIEAAINQFSWGNYAVDKLQLSLAPKIVASATDTNSLQPDAAENSTEASAADDANTETAQAASLAQNIRRDIGNDNYVLNFSASQLRVPGNRFSTLNVNGEGSINNHQLQSTIRHADYGRADIKIDGEYQEGAWQGQFEQLAIKLKKVPRWWLTSSKPIRVTADAIVIDRQCFTTRTNLTGQVEKIAEVEQEQVIGEWNANQSYAAPNYNWLTRATRGFSGVETYSLPQLCIDGDWAKTTGARLNANMDSVPLRQFLYLFKTEVYFAGVMDGSLHLQSPDVNLASTKANMNITTRNAELRYQYVGGATEVYAWRNFFVRATLANSTLNANAAMEWTGFGNINASSQLDLKQQKFNSGKLIAQFTNLAPLETLLPFANDVKGDLRADISLGGTFARPQVVGDVSLRNGAANLPRLGLDLSNVEVQLNSTQSGDINLVSQLQSGDGRLSIVSDLRGAGTPDWTVTGFVNGNNVEVVDLSQLKATLSPDIKISANREVLDLTGTATIPWARTNFKRLPESATAESPDAVVVDEQVAQENTDTKMQIHTNLDIALGNDVQFSGFGLVSKLSGKIKLLKEAQRQFFTSGFVSVDEGTYKAYGQTLTIERGRLLFQGPYENPGIEIRASRIIQDEDNTKVGLDITGTLQRPKATVFSSESLSESQAMMMLLTGKPMADASKADASMLVSAMGGLGMDSGGGIKNEITRFFGVDQLEIKSDKGFDQSELWVGKYLTPRLLVRYVVGIFDQAFGFGVEYQLTDRLRLEAESGETQSVDVVYKIER